MGYRNQRTGVIIFILEPMRKIGLIFIILFQFVFLIYHLSTPYDAKAQCTMAWCNQQHPGEGYDCWFSCGATDKCCKCEYGNAPKGTYGPLVCAASGCNNPNANGCLSPTPTEPPQQPTSTGIPPSPTTPPATGNWLCINPGSTGSKCEMEANLNCPNPDIIGAACFTTQARCEMGCTHMSPPPFISKTPLELLCTIVPGRFGINTAIGCFPADSTNDMLVFILRWALGVAGGIAFLLIIFSAFLIMSSGGNAEKVKSGRELLTAALTGLVVLIFSVFILDLIGLRILQIPGL